jgi:hypothetical protein
MLAKNNLHDLPDGPPPTIPTSAFICVHLRLKKQTEPFSKPLIATKNPARQSRNQINQLKQPRRTKDGKSEIGTHKQQFRVHVRSLADAVKKTNHYFEHKETKETKMLNTFETNSVFPRVNIYMFPSCFNIFVSFVSLWCAKESLVYLVS